jgi:hypothetical protein
MSDVLISANTYTFVVGPVIAAMGEPLYHLVLEGEPRGFTTSRTHNPASKRAWVWAKQLRSLLEHETDRRYLEATKEHPLFFFTEAWYGSGVHCDPENTHKLVKDALFYEAPKGSAKDKFTSGIYSGPLQDKLRPRVEVKVWRLGQ